MSREDPKARLPDSPGQYNPLDKRNLAKSVADALLQQTLGPLPPQERFLGAGIYAIYYAGRFEPYAPISRTETPIYVGKAVPAGARKGGFGLDTHAGAVLYGRLREHGESIEQATNLVVTDFTCRYLVVDDIWIPLGESLLIETFQPIWNVVIPGFGIHDPGAGRLRQRCSEWDTVHPGRLFAERLAPNDKTTDQILENLLRFFEGKPAELPPGPET